MNSGGTRVRLREGMSRLCQKTAPARGQGRSCASRLLRSSHLSTHLAQAWLVLFYAWPTSLSRLEAFKGSDDRSFLQALVLPGPERQVEMGVSDERPQEDDGGPVAPGSSRFRREGLAAGGTGGFLFLPEGGVTSPLPPRPYMVTVTFSFSSYKEQPFYATAEGF